MSKTATPTGHAQSRDHIPKSLKLTPAPHIPEIPCQTADNILHHWHLKLNHAPLRTIQNIAKTKTVHGLPASLATTEIRISCSACSHAKQRPARQHPTPHHYATGEYLSSDTCGPIHPRSTHGNLHFLTYIDAASSNVILYFLKSRNKVGIIMPQFFAQLKRRKRLPKIYSTDNARDFKSNHGLQTYAALGIQYENNTPHQPQENSLADRINQTLMNAARANLHHANLPATYWEDTIRDAAYKYNILPHSATRQAPYTQWHDLPAKPKQLLIFGQLGTVPIYAHKKKLESRSRPARYMFANIL